MPFTEGWASSKGGRAMVYPAGVSLEWTGMVKGRPGVAYKAGSGAVGLGRLASREGRPGGRPSGSRLPAVSWGQLRSQPHSTHHN